MDHPSPLTREPNERFWGLLKETVGRAVIGIEQPLRLLTVSLLAGGHALIDDVPGVGKTLLANAFTRATGLQFSRVQGTPDLLPSDITGSSVLDRNEFRFVPGPVFTNVLLADEINRATPRTQAALLEAMQEGQVSIDGQIRPLPEPFMVVATENPVEFEGTFPLPEAQRDRFLVRIELGYPSEEDERSIARRYREAPDPLEYVTPVLELADVLGLRDAARRVAVSDEVERYVVALVRATRSLPELRLGASPRSAVALYRASQASALIAGRRFVLPDDVAAIAPAVLGHRLVLGLDAELRGRSTAELVTSVIQDVPLPLGLTV
ncbi:MAG: MoxR family ATPase [Chloroflexota bacterium]|nr:MoxR family ATPase [Chloroflexota bacterium]